MAEEHEGASVQERLIEACRRNNVDLLKDSIEELGSEDKVAEVLNKTTTVMGNHLFHEAAAQGNWEAIDMLLDQPGFECDPVNRIEGDTPLHTVIRWINSEPPAQREYGKALVEMMIEAGCSLGVKNKAKLVPAQLVDPSNKELRDLFQMIQYKQRSHGDFINADTGGGGAKNHHQHQQQYDVAADEESDDDAEFSGSDEEERAEWERRRKQKGKA